MQLQPARCSISNHSTRPPLRRWPLAVRGALQPTPRPGQSGRPQGQRGDLQVVAGATDYPLGPGQQQQQQPLYGDPGPSFGGPDSTGRLGDAARQSLASATSALRRYGWLAFWAQLTLSVVSGVILLFSVAFTSQSGPKASLYLTLVGILAGFLSTFWNFGYQRTSARMQEYLDGVSAAKVKKQQVLDLVTRGIVINLVGLGATLLGISTLVGLLVAKTLSNASVNPFMASAAGGYNPVLALDVFLVQAATNTLLGHFLSLLCSLWLLNVVGEGRGLRFQRQQHMQQLKSDGPGGALMSGTVKGMAGVYDIPSLKNRGGGGGSGGGGGGWRTAATAAASSAWGGLASGGATSSSSLGGHGLGGAALGFSSSAAVVPQAAAGVAAAAAGLAGAVAAASDALSVSPTAAALIGSSRADAAAAASSSNSMGAWRAAAQPAAAAAAAMAADLAAAGLPAPPVRAGRSPEERLGSDLLLAPTAASLAYLDGSLPGDAGWDPLGLFEPQQPGRGGAAAASGLDRRWLVTSEVLHARWAMLAVAGCLLPEALGRGPWFDALPGVERELAAAAAAAGAGGVSSSVVQQQQQQPHAGGLVDGPTLLGLALLGMAAAEGARWADYVRPGSMGVPLQPLLPRVPRLAGSFAGSGVPPYPGGPLFDSLGLAERDGAAVGEAKGAELAAGRAAMVALVGFVVQAAVTGEGPLANLAQHTAAPLQHNLLVNVGHVLDGSGGVPEGAEGGYWFGERPYGGGEDNVSLGVVTLHWTDRLWVDSQKAAEAAAAAAGALQVADAS